MQTFSKFQEVRKATEKELLLGFLKFKMKISGRAKLIWGHYEIMRLTVFKKKFEVLVLTQKAD